MAAPSFNIDSSKLQIMAELEIEMMADMYNRMTRACQRKCIPKKYKDAELSKGESVCIDRCVAKYLDVHENIGKKLTTLSKADEETAKKMHEQQEAAMKAASKWGHHSTHFIVIFVSSINVITSYFHCFVYSPIREQ